MIEKCGTRPLQPAGPGSAVGHIEVASSARAHLAGVSPELKRISPSAFPDALPQRLRSLRGRILSIKKALCAGFFSPFSRALLPLRCTVRLWPRSARPQVSADQPYTIEYYYKCQWGHQKEFYDLFIKNHYPLLKKIQSTGRILSIKIESPAYHTSEELRWDYRVTIRYKNSTVATTANPDEEASSRNSAGPGDLHRGKSSGDLRFSSGILTCR